MIRVRLNDDSLQKFLKSKHIRRAEERSLKDNKIPEGYAFYTTDDSGTNSLHTVALQKRYCAGGTYCDGDYVIDIISV